jgi:hypothetical protein
MLAEAQQAAPAIVEDGVDSPHHHEDSSASSAQPELWTQISESLDLAGRMDRQPYQTLMVAAGVGFLASGALFSRFSMRAIGMVVRLAVLPAIEKQVAEAGARATSRTVAS